MLIKNSFIQNPFFSPRKEILVFPNERTKQVEGEYIDIYTEYFKGDFFNNKTCLYLERPYIGKHIREKSKDKKYLDYFIFLGNVLQYFQRVQLSDSQRATLISLQQDIFKEMKVNLNIEQLFIDAVRRYKIDYKLYTKLFKKLCPSEIYIVTGLCAWSCYKGCERFKYYCKRNSTWYF